MWLRYISMYCVNNALYLVNLGSVVYLANPINVPALSVMSNIICIRFSRSMYWSKHLIVPLPFLLLLFLFSKFSTICIVSQYYTEPHRATYLGQTEMFDQNLALKTSKQLGSLKILPSVYYSNHSYEGQSSFFRKLSFRFNICFLGFALECFFVKQNYQHKQLYFYPNEPLSNLPPFQVCPLLFSKKIRSL